MEKIWRKGFVTGLLISLASFLVLNIANEVLTDENFSLSILVALSLVFGTTVPFTMWVLHIVRPLMSESDVQRRIYLFKKQLAGPKIVLTFTGYIALACLAVAIILPGGLFGLSILEIIAGGSIIGLTVGGLCALILWFYFKQDLPHMYSQV